jgi:hypothetical protein
MEMEGFSPPVLLYYVYDVSRNLTNRCPAYKVVSLCMVGMSIRGGSACPGRITACDSTLACAQGRHRLKRSIQADSPVPGKSGKASVRVALFGKSDRWQRGGDSGGVCVGQSIHSPLLIFDVDVYFSTVRGGYPQGLEPLHLHRAEAVSHSLEMSLI